MERITADKVGNMTFVKNYATTATSAPTSTTATKSAKRSSSATAPSTTMTMATLDQTVTRNARTADDKKMRCVAVLTTTAYTAHFCRWLFLSCRK